MIIISLSDRRSSGFCSDSERRESSGIGRHGWVKIDDDGDEDDIIVLLMMLTKTPMDVGTRF